MIEVNLKDSINFICPYYEEEDADDVDYHEYYIIHQVRVPQAPSSTFTACSIPSFPLQDEA